MTTPVAVVGGADTPTGLAIARSLTGGGVRVVGLAVDPGAPACRSRRWTEVRPVAAPTAPAWLDAIEGACRAHGRVVLMPADDAVVRVVAQHRARVDEVADVVLPPLDVVETLLDKTLFHPWALAHGFPVPATEVAATDAELRAALGRLRFPVVLKPFERTVAWQAVSLRDKVRRLDAPADLDRLGFAPFDTAERFVVQEWIPGRDSDVWFCLVHRDRDGHELGAVTGRKIVQWPVDTGSSALAVTAEDAQLHRLTRQLFDAAGLVGLGSLEVRRDVRDGRMVITEPTVGRPNLQSGLAAAAGVPLALLAYRDAAGLPQSPVAGARPAVWAHESNLPRAVAVAGFRRRLDGIALTGAVKDTVTGGRAAAFAFTGRNDPRPVLAEGRRAVRKAWRSAVGRVRSRRSVRTGKAQLDQRQGE